MLGVSSSRRVQWLPRLAKFDRALAPQARLQAGVHFFMSRIASYKSVPVCKTLPFLYATARFLGAMEADFYMTPDRPRELISCSVRFPGIENLSVCLRHSLILLDRRNRSLRRALFSLRCPCRAHSGNLAVSLSYSSIWGYLRASGRGLW